MKLKQTGNEWRQLNLWCNDWRAAEKMAVERLFPLLSDAEQAGSIPQWWFVRKGASWRLRMHPGNGPQGADYVDQLAHTLYSCGVLDRHAEVIYEPEVHAFGGPEAMDIAHRLFHADSRQVLRHLASSSEQDHRRELGLLLGTRLLRAASLDWCEQGDVWARVASHRDSRSQEKPSARTVAAVQHLLNAAADTDKSPLQTAPTWRASFEDAGSALDALYQEGKLTRGLRAVLAEHMLFAFNRLGVPAEQQYLLASSASLVIFHQDPRAIHPGGAAPSVHADPTTVSEVINAMTDTTAPGPQQLRAALVDRIRSRGTFQTAAVEAAFRTVPRHLFLPGVDLATAYAPKPVVTKRGEDGTAISSASSPNLVAQMLEQLAVRPGHRVLEIGAATGINAALLTELVGPTGHVVTIELDEDLATGARTALATAGYGDVKVICGDGALGHPPAAPYDRIIVTAGAWDISAGWWDQLATGGRLVVPLRMHGSGLTRSIAFDCPEPGLLTSASALVCGFVPMRGADEHDEIAVRLADDVVLHVDAADAPDEDVLAQTLTHPAHIRWTGIHVRDDQPIEHLDLWLLTTADDMFGRLSAGAVARDTELVVPARRWAGACLYHGGALAYLAARELDQDVDELGVIAHGPDSAALADRLTELLHSWDQQRPAQPVVAARRVGTKDDSGDGRPVLRPNTAITITW